MAQRASKIWAVRMPGGPTRIIKSDRRPLSEEDAKREYTGSFKFKSAECLNDPDQVWPLLEPIDETQLQSYAHLLEPSKITGLPRALIEV